MRVCIVSEGSYPITKGGLSEWAHLLIKTSKYIDFDVLCIGPDKKYENVYDRLPNLHRVIVRPLACTNGNSHRTN